MEGGERMGMWWCVVEEIEWKWRRWTSMKEKRGENGDVEVCSCGDRVEEEEGEEDGKEVKTEEKWRGSVKVCCRGERVEEEQ